MGEKVSTENMFEVRTGENRWRWVGKDEARQVGAVYRRGIRQGKVCHGMSSPFSAWVWYEGRERHMIGGQYNGDAAALGALHEWLDNAIEPTGDAELKPEAPKPEPAIEVLTGLGDAQRWEPLPDGEEMTVGYTYRRAGMEGVVHRTGERMVTARVWHEGKSRQMTGADFIGDGCEHRALDALIAWFNDGTPPDGDLVAKPKPQPEPPPADEVATLRAEVERLKVYRDRAVELADRLGAKNVGLEGDNKQLCHTIDQLTAERDAALAKVEELREAAKDRAYWEQQGGDVLRAEIARLTAELDEARKQTERAHANIAEILRESADVRADRDKRADKLDAYYAHQRAILGDLEDVRAERDALAAELSALKASGTVYRAGQDLRAGDFVAVPNNDRAEAERLRVDLAQAREEISRLTALQESSARDKRDHDDHVLGLCAARATVEGVLKKCLDVALVELRHATQEKTLAQTRMAREAGEEVDT